MRRTALALVIALTTVACGSTGATDKTGETTTVLRVVNFDSINPNGQNPAAQVFLQQLLDLSGGQLKVDVDNHFKNGEPTAETDEITAVIAGEYDVAWPSTRAFSAAGITSLQPLEAPLLITSLDAERALVKSAVADELLDTLRDQGLIGLGLAVGPLRRPMATDPLLSTSDWQGVRFRAYNSPVQQAALEHLGSAPVNASYTFPELVRTGQLDGVESDIAQYDENNLGDLLPHVTRNIVLWPKIFVFTMNAGAFDRLTARQQEWVTRAAQAAVQASVDYQYDEATPAARMCKNGVLFHDATVGELRDLKEAVQPVVTQLSSDPVSGPLLAKVESVIAAVPGIDVPEVPAGCLR